MDVLDLDRMQFGVTTVYHFLFVPLTIGLSLLVAILQSLWRATGRTAYLRATKFWGKLFLVTIAMGVVTGIVQEFQFGMNWSAYARFVGDVFGAPLAFEALVAFLLESAFIGVWVFGWDRLRPALHLAAIWLVACGAMASAYFVLAADAFMQNPVGYRLNETAGRAELTDFGAVLTNPVALAAFPHTVFAAWLTAGAVVIAVSGYHFMHRRDLDVHRPAMRLGVLTTVVGGLGLVLSGVALSKVMTATRPMKMAAAEALYQTTFNAPFSVLTIGSVEGRTGTPVIEIPGLLPYLATGSPDGEVHGVNDLNDQYNALYGSGDYVPYLPLAHWSFRAVIGFGMLAVAMAVVVWWCTRRGRMPRHRLFWPVAMSTAVAPFLANSAGWIFTETGRRPWAVFGLYQTHEAVSPRVGMPAVAASFIGVTLVYLVLTVVALKLFLAFAKAGPPDEEGALAASSPSGEPEKPMAFAYWPQDAQWN
ncbi:cytochrome ubiquinol oxidase subunit I [Glycomyces sp. TRM65418]|uniref:cytochrome ubiquinol oxidase subunit I n=1 Tax=Glycomyces sp. TRM65418 TaxID=2867006 RepID=UPI001CE6D908|nr:cytochrome ubiquinol oxidase subunit I [Glycomyces sp. TRM65418]MCC3765440.1 cytochrome ubiquinol oxidase subunit I [Glycomyces sp. TRM65418]QZD55050.1 cytochrome ubiquinol oxidase subunit I [Glycomyces sp. TRM65418]